MFYFTKKPWILKQIYGKCTWEIDTKEKDVYLTFDDGPHPTDTPFILGELKKFNAKGTFFCLGRNVSSYPDIYRSLIEEGHEVGNHTYEHLDGWRTRNELYYRDLEKASELIDSHIFRPPYGHITRFEVNTILQKYNLKTIMWSIMAGDFDQKTSGEQCYHNVVDNIRPGSIVVFHDNDSASKNLRYALPRTLEFLAKNGYNFRSIS